jgi:hypothetical protein
MGLSVAFFILESGYKQVQDQYISKSLAIERTLNDLLVDEPEPFIPEGGISTSITKPTIGKCFTTLKHRNWFFWLPYFVVILVCFLMWYMGISANEATPKVALVTDSSIDAKSQTSSVRGVSVTNWERQWTRIADSLGDIDLHLSKERPLTLQLQLPTPAVTKPSPTPGPSHPAIRRGRRH